jgi:hypothetical protein
VQIPLQQAPTAGTPLVIQQPASQPPAQMVIIQGPPAAQAAPAAAPLVTYSTGIARASLPLGMGLTRNETLARDMEIARANFVGEPQDFKPADDNPNRLYWCRELTNEFVLRDRRTIDQMGCRWYMQPDGAFYAVKLP